MLGREARRLLQLHDQFLPVLEVLLVLEQFVLFKSNTANEVLIREQLWLVEAVARLLMLRWQVTSRLSLRRERRDQLCLAGACPIRS